MAIDQRDVSSTLRFMDDRALQQYAAMHKNDPYIFPLAFQESQNRQRLRMSQQGAQGMQPQPKVADQALAQMASQPLPEDVGIGALPAPNMTMAAEGGIMGYEGYDERPSDFGQGPVMMMSGGGVARYNGAQGSAVSLNAIESKYQKELQEINTGARVQYSPDVQEYVNARAQTSPDSTPVQVNPIPNAPPQAPARPPLGSSLSSSLYSNITSKERARFDALQAAKQKNALKTPFEQERTANMAEIAKGSTYTPEAYSVTKPAPLFSDAQRSQALVPSAKKPKEIIKDERKGTDPKPNASVKPADASVKPSVLDPKAMFATELEKTSNEVRPEKALLEKLIADRKKADEDDLTGLKGLNAKFADAFKSKRERLDTREGAIDKMKDQNLGLALLQAGARMMSTRGSVGEAIGAGVDTGSKQYVAGLDKINSAKDKLADARDRLDGSERYIQGMEKINAAKDKFAEARDRLDDLQLNRDEMSAREILKAENKIRQTALAGQETMIKYVMERDKVDRETAMKIVDNEVKIALNRDDNVSREKVARISAEPALERNKLLKLANNKDDKVRTEYGKLQAKVMDTLSKDPNYTMANPMQQQVLQTTALRQALMSNPFLAPYAAGIGFSSAPTGGKVYDLTTD